MTKQEKIQETYGELYNEVIPDKNGWIDFDKIPDNLYLLGFEAIKYSEPENNFTTTLLRPKSLQGIENNNGWIKIESDLPEETECHFYDIKNKDYWTAMVDEFGDFAYSTKATHYQPITKPQPPIY